MGVSPYEKKIYAQKEEIDKLKAKLQTAQKRITELEKQIEAKRYAEDVVRQSKKEPDVPNN